MNTRRKKSNRIKFSQHHTIPVSDNIDWHLTNLWNEGFKTIISITQKQHMNIHKKKGIKYDDI